MKTVPIEERTWDRAYGVKLSEMSLSGETHRQMVFVDCYFQRICPEEKNRCSLIVSKQSVRERELN